jgi:hypothetical protein
VFAESEHNRHARIAPVRASERIATGNGERRCQLGTVFDDRVLAMLERIRSKSRPIFARNVSRQDPALARRYGAVHPGKAEALDAAKLDFDVMPDGALSKTERFNASAQLAQACRTLHREASKTPIARKIESPIKALRVFTDDELYSLAFGDHSNAPHLSCYDRGLHGNLPVNARI